MSSRWESRITFTDPSASLREVYWATESLTTTRLDGKEVPAVNKADFVGAFGRPQTGFSSLMGSATVQSNGNASFDLKVAADQTTEGDEQFRVVFYKDSRRTQELHRTEVMTIKDSSLDRLTYQSDLNASPIVDQNGTPILSRDRSILESSNNPSTQRVNIRFRTNDKDLSSVYWTTQSVQKVAIGNGRFDAVNKADFLAPDGQRLTSLLPLSGVATVRDGSASIPLIAAADHVIEGDEKFRVVFYKDVDLTREVHRTELITIKDTSNRPLVSLESTADKRVREGYNYLLTLSREGSTNNSLDVRLNFDGEARLSRDYRVLNNSLRFEEGESQLKVRLQTFDDALDEGPPETLSLVLLNSPEYEINPQKSRASLSLEEATVLQSNIPVSVEGGTLQFKLTRSNPDQNYSNPLYVVAVVDDGLARGAAGAGAKAGEDYRRDGAFCFVFPAENREATINVSTVDDRLSESAYEDLRLQVIAPVAGLVAYTFTGIIADDDRDSVTGHPLSGGRAVAKQIQANPDYGAATRINPGLVVDQLRTGLRKNPGFITALQRDISKRGGLVGNDSASLVGNDSASLVGNDSAGLVGNDSASIAPGATEFLRSASSLSVNDTMAALALIANGGGNLIANGGGNLIANGGSNLIANGGGNLIANGGGN